MTPEERDLRRALAARSAAPSPEFLARLSTARDAGPHESRLMPAIAMVCAAALTVATIGALLLATHLGAPVRHGPGPAIRSASPSPTPTGKGGQVIYLPTDVQLSAPSAGVVWALVADQILFRSEDAGDNWEQRTMPRYSGGYGPIQISFADEFRGWMLFPGVPETQCNGAGLQLWRTVDGAKSWELVASVTGPTQPAGALGYAQCKSNPSLVDATHGFITAWDDNRRPTVYRTSDGGVSWRASVLPDPPGFVTGAGGFALHAGIVKASGGVLLLTAYGMQADGARGYVFRSTDGGATWEFLARLQDNPGAVALVSSMRWVRIENDHAGSETTDAGRTWHAFDPDYSDAAGVVSSFVFADERVGYGTVRGAIQRTLDGGLHWTRLETPGVFWPG